MAEQVILVCAGAAIVLVSSCVTIVLQHFLAIRLDRITRERDNTDEERKNSREDLLRGVEELTNRLSQTGNDLTRILREEREVDVTEEVPRHSTKDVDWTTD